MVGFLAQQNKKSFSLKGVLGGFLERYYSTRRELGDKDESWLNFKEDTSDMELEVSDRYSDLTALYSQDVTRSYTVLTAGNMVAFDYISLKGVRKSYIATIVAAYGSNGVFGKISTKHDLLTCFLIDSGTDLDILAPVMNVIQEKLRKQKSKTYKTLSSTSKSRDRININIQKKELREKADVSKDGMKALFPSSEFRTFILNTNMIRIYRINLNG
tara:strand:- start:2918 stop:3562 length:645 start_codon:yes stop_codon:yes gene_type:complete